MKAAAGDPLCALPEPVSALRRLAAATPAFRDGTWAPLGLIPRRYEVRRSGRVDLACDVRFRDASGRVQERPVLIEPGDGQEPRLFLSPDDPEMPWAAERLEELAAALGPGSLQILAHRFGRRVTLQWTSGSGTAANGRDSARRLILKVYSGGEDARAAATLRALSAADLPLRTPRLVAHLPEDGLVIQASLPGASAHDVLRSGSALPAAALGRALTAVRSVQADGLREHRLADELAVVRKLADRAAVVDAELADDLRAAAGGFDDKTGPLVFAHRDLHDKQVLCDGPHLGLIDWDLAALAPLALDPGNFLAHLTLRVLQGRVPPERAEATRAAFLEGLGPDTEAARDLHRWMSVAMLRLVGVYALRPAWPGLSRRILAAFHRMKETA